MKNQTHARIFGESLLAPWVLCRNHIAFVLSNILTKPDHVAAMVLFLGSSHANGLDRRTYPVGNQAGGP